MVVEEISTTGGLHEIWEDWHRLWTAIPGSTPFQAPDWLIPWWLHLGEGELLTLVVRDSGFPVGLLPLYIYPRSLDGLRQLLPLGVGTTDYLDVLVAPGKEREALTAACARLEDLRDRWDEWDFPQLPGKSPLLAFPAPIGWTGDRNESLPCPALTVSGEGVASSLPTSMRRNLRSDRRFARESGPVHIEEVSERALDENFEVLVRLHRARWQAKGEEGVLSSDRVVQTHREIAGRFFQRKMLGMPVLKIASSEVAALYGLVDRRAGRYSFFYYLGGFDTSFGRVSPGTILIGHVLEQIAAAGGGTFDFLRGREPYKYRWGATDQPTYRCRFWHGE